MNQYKLTVKHDTGKVVFSIVATDETTAKQMVMSAEGCPERAIVKIVETPILYKVFKVGRKSNRRQILRRGLTEQEAQRVVRSYPDSSRSMVCYTRQ